MVGLLAAGVAGYWGYNQQQEKQQLQIYMGNNYQQAFYDLVENVEQLQVLLGKSLVSTSPRQNIMLLTDVWSYANVAQADLNKLPLAAQTVYQTAKFLSQTGDYAHVMAEQNAEGKVLTEENRKTLSQLRQHSIQIAELLQDVEQQAMAGEIDWKELVKSTRQQIKKEDGKTNLGGFDDIRDETSKIPTLIYDGPFSDQITESKPKGLDGKNISKDAARDKVREVIDSEDVGNIEISAGTSVEGRLPSYNFQVKTDKGNYSVDISQKGGYLVSLLSSRNITNSKISQEAAVDKAKDYLSRNGYPNMEPTYSEVKDNTSYISFAYKQDNIIYYPDIINVQVALDNGQIIAVEALNYLMSHHTREPKEPNISEDEARQTADTTLEKTENVRLAVIPQPALKEAFTYEVRGTVGTETYLIYINADTGDEEQILKVIKGNKGTFAL